MAAQDEYGIDEVSVFGEQFIDAVEHCVYAGLSSKQVKSIVELVVITRKMLKQFDGTVLAERAERTAKSYEVQKLLRKTACHDGDGD